MPGQGRFRPPVDHLVVFDGQSLNLYDNGRYPDQLMATHPGIAWVNIAIGAASWATLATTVTTRRDPWASRARQVHLVMCGGTADYNGGALAATVETRMNNYATSARAAGFASVLNSTTTPASYLTAGEDAERVAGNGLILAQPAYPAPGGYFDGVANFAAAPLDDYNDATYYRNDAGQKVHWTNAGGLEAGFGAVSGNGGMDALLAPLLV